MIEENNAASNSSKSFKNRILLILILLVIGVITIVGVCLSLAISKDSDNEPNNSKNTDLINNEKNENVQEDETVEEVDEYVTFDETVPVANWYDSSDIYTYNYKGEIKKDVKVEVIQSTDINGLTTNVGLQFIAEGYLLRVDPSFEGGPAEYSEKGFQKITSKYYSEENYRWEYERKNGKVLYSYFISPAEGLIEGDYMVSDGMSLNDIELDVICEVDIATPDKVLECDRILENLQIKEIESD